MNSKLLKIARYLGNNGFYEEAANLKKLASDEPVTDRGYGARFDGVSRSESQPLGGDWKRIDGFFGVLTPDRWKEIEESAKTPGQKRWLSTDKPQSFAYHSWRPPRRETLEENPPALDPLLKFWAENPEQNPYNNPPKEINDLIDRAGLFGEFITPVLLENEKESIKHGGAI